VLAKHELHPDSAPVHWNSVLLSRRDYLSLAFGMSCNSYKYRNVMTQVLIVHGTLRARDEMSIESDVKNRGTHRSRAY
jgi:hypothetical protein